MDEDEFRNKDFRVKPINGSPIIRPAADLPTNGMKMLISTKNGLLTIEFEKQVQWLHFNKADANRFVQGLVAHIRGME